MSWTVLLLLSICRPAELVQDSIVLRSGVPHSDELAVGPFDAALATFLVDVPTDAIALEVSLSCRKADLDLHVRRLDDPDGEQALSSVLAGGIDRVTFDRFSVWPLRSGRYEIEVDYALEGLPVWEGETLAKVDFSVTATVRTTRVDAELEPGVQHASRIESDSGRFRSFRIDVPEDAPALRIDVADTHGDLDLYLRRGKPIVRITQAMLSAEGFYGRETLVVTRDTRPRLHPGPWYVDVVEHGFVEDPPIPFTLLASFDAAPPPELLVIPPMRQPDAAKPLSRALSSVVDLYAGELGGSGTLISERGWILTNAHVVSDFADQPVEEVIVAATIDRSRPAVEMFRARVERFDHERDLALLRIHSGFYRQPVRPEYRFPTVALGDADELDFGDPIWCVGYPGTGGLGGRVSITAVAGMVCGFEAAHHGAWIKSDAEIAPGSSGGAAVNARGELIGVPTSTVEDSASQLSYLVPISALPGEWLEHLARSTPSGANESPR